MDHGKSEASIIIAIMGAGPSKQDRLRIVRGEPDAPLPPEYLERIKPQSSSSSAAAASAGTESSHDSSSSSPNFQTPSYPVPTGREHEFMDDISKKLPRFMDEVTRQRVIQASEQCQEGKGQMIPCFNHAEFLTQFQSRHQEAADFFVNTCFRPKTDRSPHGVLVDDSKCFPAACFQLANMRMTGKGGTKFDRSEAYHLYDRGCRGGHGGACHFQARMLLSYPGQLGPGIPYNPQLAAELFDKVCYKHNDPVSCFTLASLYLRGDQVSSEAAHVTPQEARGLQKIQPPSAKEMAQSPQAQQAPQYTNATPSSLQYGSSTKFPRAKDPKDERKPLKRDPKKAMQVLLHACNELQHGGACHNLAVMYTQGDDGVPPDDEKAKYYQNKTEELMKSGAGIFPF